MSMPKLALSASEWEAHIKTFKESGLSRKKYCDQANILYHQFQYYYHHHYQKVPHSPQAVIKKAQIFAPITMKSTPSIEMLELKLPNGISCRLPVSIELDYVKKLMVVLS